MRVLCISLVSLGALIMLLSIFRYCKALANLKSRMKADKLFGERIYAVCLLMMAFFLVGYIICIAGFSSGAAPDMQALLIACIFFFGAVFVFAMIMMMQRMFSAMIDNSDLTVAREVAEHSNKAKSTFLSNMSHEIRTPMNAILGITEIQLQRGALEPGVKEAFEKIYSSGDLLLGIINDILDLSKIEAGKLELNIDKYDTASLINDTAQLNMMRIAGKPIDFELFADENIPASLEGDELRVKQILNNILSNAFKYTAEGAVKFAVYPEGAGDDESITLVFSVSDTGQGMTKEEVSKLFEMYSQFNRDANRTTEGTGLGMNITRNLIDMMNGSIDVESEPGKGSVFTVRLPQRKTGAGVLGKDLADNLKKSDVAGVMQMKRVQISRAYMPYGSVLVVDDVETNIYVAKGLLAPYGLNVDSADSGYAAIEKIEQGSEYDIVFMDHMMPNMDGIEATKIIRELGYTKPIVALTANAIAGQAEIFLDSGFDDFISKPIDIRQLNFVLNRLVRDKQPPEVREAAQAKKSGADAFIADTFVEYTIGASAGENAGEGKSHDNWEKPELDPELAEIFARDVGKSLAALGAVCEKGDYSSEETLKSYIIHVHGMKSVLANVGEHVLSERARMLEAAGREGDTTLVEAQTPAFLADLRAFAAELVPMPDASDEDNGAAQGEEDRVFLSEMLSVIKSACEEYDEHAAREALMELKKTTWSKQIRDILDPIAEQLLHSDFDEIIESIEEYILPPDP